MGLTRCYKTEVFFTFIITDQIATDICTMFMINVSSYNHHN